MRELTLILCLLFTLAGCGSDVIAPKGKQERAVIPPWRLGLIKPPHRRHGVLHFTPKRFAAPIPENFDWVEQGFGTPVRDQKQCGSCWAFAGTQPLEMGYKIFAHQDIDFSEQQLVGNLYYGCDGGYFTYDFQTKYGQTDEKSCPYTQSNHKCSTALPAAGKALAGGQVGKVDRSPSVSEIQTAIQTYGALAVTVGADNAFMRIKSDDAGCGGNVGTNHMVTLVGWKTVSGKVLFHVKNSWNTTWGNKGYSWIGLGCWNLGEDASWVAVPAVPCQPPAVKLPAEYSVTAGDTVVLAAKSIQGVTYQWLEGTTVLGSEASLEYTAKVSTTLTLKVHNACGDGEIKTLITVK